MSLLVSAGHAGGATFREGATDQTLELSLYPDGTEPAPWHWRSVS